MHYYKLHVLVSYNICMISCGDVIWNEELSYWGVHKVWHSLHRWAASDTSFLFTVKHKHSFFCQQLSFFLLCHIIKIIIEDFWISLCGFSFTGLCIYVHKSCFYCHLISDSCICTFACYTDVEEQNLEAADSPVHSSCWSSAISCLLAQQFGQCQ